MTAITLPASDLITIQNNQPRTTSLKVAEAFGRLHKNVIQKLESLDCSEEFASANFSAHEQEIQAGAVKRKSKVYEMTKDGFMFLVMGFTGKKAAQIKEAYINAFNEMAEKIYGKPAPAKKRKPKALPNGLTIDQQDTIKSLVKARVDALPPAKRAKAAITCWSSLKSKFGCTYKEIEPDHFTDAVSLVARVPLEGEYIEAESAPAAKLTDEQSKRISCIKTHSSGLKRKLSAFMKSAMETSKPEKRDELARHYREVREHAHVIDSQSEGLLSSGVTHDTPETEQAGSHATLTQVDLAILYGFSMSALQLVDMGERLKPAIDALKPLSLFGVDARLETCRQSIGWLHDKVGAEMEAAAKESGLYKDYVDLRAAKDRSRPIITLDD